MSKVNIISGFLGAGKTTFIKELLEKVFKGQKIVLIENEFGEIGIDVSFLKEAGIEITEMNSGCICCSLVGDFAKALAQVSERFNPDRILIEPSGVGKLSDVEIAIKGVPGIKLESGITVVDAKKAKKYLRNFGEFFNNQVQFADTVVLSRTADIDEEKLHETLHIIRELNPSAPIITTPWENLTGETLLKALSEKNPSQELAAALLEAEEHHREHEHHHHHHDVHDEHEHHHHEHDEDEHEHEHHHEHDEDEHEHDHQHYEHHHDHDEHEHHHEHHHHHDHDADEVFDTVGGETVHSYSEEELGNILKDLAGTEKYGFVVRSKGIVPMTDGTWREFDLVPEETEVRPCAPDYSGRIVVIGTNLKEHELREILKI
ncbi:MAG: GTP-binding protein [Lachnospiraceae bacterium]|nr:GTP-binding protein [Lachnospiraceae bacterium]